MGTAIDMAFDGATLAACPLSALVLSFAFYGFPRVANRAGRGNLPAPA